MNLTNNKPADNLTKVTADPLLTQKIIELSAQHLPIVPTLYSALILCVLAHKSPTELGAALKPGVGGIKSRLAPALSILATDLKLDLSVQFEPLPEEIIADLASLAYSLKNNLTEVGLEIHEFIQNNQKRLGFSTHPKAVRDITCALLTHYQKQRSLNSFYDFNGRIGGLMLCSVMLDTDKHEQIEIYVEESIPFFQQIGQMLLTLTHPHAKLSYSLCETLPHRPLKENNMRFDCVVSHPIFEPARYLLKSPLKVDILKSESYLTEESISILLGLEGLKVGGIALIIVADGFLHKRGTDRETRKKLVREDSIKAIITLPNNIYIGTTLSTSLLILQKNKEQSKAVKGKVVTMIDLSQETLDLSTIKKMVNNLNQQSGTSSFPVRQVPVSEIMENGYRLKPVDYLQQQMPYIKPSFNSIVKGLDEVKREFEDAYSKWKTHL